VLLLVLADTHVRDGSTRSLPAQALTLAREADAILHAGDVVEAGFLRSLADLAPTYAVLGNNDHTLSGRLPTQRVEAFDGVRIGMVHDSGLPPGRAERLRRWFPTEDVVVFGHSHVPLAETGVDGQLLFNPGSPIERRRQPHHTVGLLEVARGAIVRHEIRLV
jgi:uncharacterized protein